MPSNTLSSDGAPATPSIYLTIAPRLYLLPGVGLLVGSMIGLRRGARMASLQFLAENAHRAPTTVQGWYFYNKTKNYRVLMAGLKEAGREAGKLGATAAVWVALEEGCTRVGGVCEEVREVVAGTGTAGVFAGVYGLPWKTGRRVVVLGAMIGVVLRGLRWSRESLRAEAEARKIAGTVGGQAEKAAGEGRD